MSTYKIKCILKFFSFSPSVPIHSNSETLVTFKITPPFFKPLQSDMKLYSMKRACFECPMFSICNGCRKTIKDFKKHNVVEEHCKIMKSIAPKVLSANGLNNIELTPYIDESRNVG